MSGEKSTHVSEEKKILVKELAGLINKHKTILIASIKNLPASQFQEIGKKLRGKAIVKVPKKNLIFRAIDASGKEEVKKLKEKIDCDFALLFSDLDGFDLALELLKNKSPAKAKPGQEAPEDIEVQAGPTELVPGPAISELGAVGIQIKIEGGKINITKPKIIAKKGAKISSAAADIMSKLGIRPFSIGFIPLVAFDVVEGKLYSDINIDKSATIAELKTAYGKALAFAVEVGYANEDTIKFLIGKAHSHGKAIKNLQGDEEVAKDETVENSEDKVEEIVKDGNSEEKTGAPSEDAMENQAQKEKTAEEVAETTAEMENKEPESTEINSEGEEK